MKIHLIYELYYKEEWFLLDLFKSRFKDIKLSGTIGNFDGLHLGHQAILEKIKIIQKSLFL